VKNFSESADYKIQTYKSWHLKYLKEKEDGESSDTNSVKEPMEKKRKIEKNGVNAPHVNAPHDTAIKNLSLNEDKKSDEVFKSDNKWE